MPFNFLKKSRHYNVTSKRLFVISIHHLLGKCRIEFPYQHDITENRAANELGSSLIAVHPFYEIPFSVSCSQWKNYIGCCGHHGHQVISIFGPCTWKLCAYMSHGDTLVVIIDEPQQQFQGKNDLLCCIGSHRWLQIWLLNLCLSTYAHMHNSFKASLQKGANSWFQSFLHNYPRASTIHCRCSLFMAY